MVPLHHVRRRTWNPVLAPPPSSRPYVYKLDDNRFAYSAPGAQLLPSAVDEQRMSASAIITTPDVDRVGDIVRPEGCRLDAYMRNDVVFFGHQMEPIPVGRCHYGGLTVPVTRENLAVRVSPADVRATCFFDQDGPVGLQYFGLVKRGMITAVSIGFDPVSQPIPIKAAGTYKQGFEYPEWDLLEFSFCGTACNPYAGLIISDAAMEIRSFLDRGMIEGEKIAPIVRKSLLPLAAPRRAFLFTGDSHKPSEPMRWNKALGAEFDVAEMPSRPSSVLWDWVSRWVGQPVKRIWQSGTKGGGAALGSFLAGLQNALSPYHLDDVRNLNYDGTEHPPVYSVVQLDSKQSGDFLIDGFGFYSDVGGKFVVEMRPQWSGVSATIYTAADEAGKALNQSIVSKAHQWAKDNNFLKGEAFALSGEFLEKTAETWDDVFLEDRNKESVQRTTFLFNQKGKAFPNRGVIMTGPPGTGKTLSGRILRNTAKGTFIWVSSRDFHMSGSFSCLADAFEMAKSLSPSVLFMEDVDNWLSECTIDLLKTEMDGIARSSGVLTILTTNFPERLPGALIDRPGRFHDVLHFALPTDSARTAMLAKWLPKLSASDRTLAVQSTSGYSGAHVYELAQFVKTLQEHDGMDTPAALRSALEKIAEQKELINGVQLQGSNYRPRKDHPIRRRAMAMITKTAGRPMARKEAMNEHSGTEGGYTAPEGMQERLGEAMGGDGGVGEEKGHSVHFNAETGAVHHVYPEGATDEELERLKTMLSGVDGVTTVHQGPDEPEPESGFAQVYPHKEIPAVHEEEEEHHDEPAGEVGEEKAYRRKVSQLSALFNRLPRMAVKAMVSRCKAFATKALQDCVSAKIAKLRDEGFDADQSAAIAYSTCGEKKDYNDAGEIAGETDEKIPHGVGVAQHLLEYIEGESPAMEPENADFYSALSDDVREHAHGRYPEHGFGGQESKAEEEEAGKKPAGEEGEDEEEIEQELEAYKNPPPKSGKPKVVKRPGMGRARTLLVEKRMNKRHHGVMKEAAEHMGDMSDMESGSTFTKTHKAACKYHHGMMTKALDEMMTGTDEVEGEVPAKGNQAAIVKAAADAAASAATQMIQPLRERAYKRWGAAEFKN